MRLDGAPGVGRRRPRARPAAAASGRRRAADGILARAICSTLVGGDHLALVDLAARADERTGSRPWPSCRSIGSATRRTPSRSCGRLMHGGLGVWRATIDRSRAEATRLDLIERAASGAARDRARFSAFAPLAAARSRATRPRPATTTCGRSRWRGCVCASIPSIQVDWPLYGPKLAQVAIAYGADDIDGVAAVDTLHLGHRRSPGEDIAAADPRGVRGSPSSATAASRSAREPSGPPGRGQLSQRPAARVRAGSPTRTSRCGSIVPSRLRANCSPRRDRSRHGAVDRVSRSPGRSRSCRACASDRTARWRRWRSSRACRCATSARSRSTRRRARRPR